MSIFLSFRETALFLSHTWSTPTTHQYMPRSYTLRCKRGSGKRWHKPSGQCRTPCKKSHGTGYRRSPKEPYYKCIKANERRTSTGRKRSRGRALLTGSDRQNAMTSAALRLQAAARLMSAKRRAARATTFVPRVTSASRIQAAVRALSRRRSAEKKRLARMARQARMLA